jgi:hypothetical protein
MMPRTEDCHQPHVYSALSELGYERHLLCVAPLPEDETAEARILWRHLQISSSSRATPAAGTLVRRTPGGDAARDHAPLPRFAWQAVDEPLRSPVNPDRSEQGELAGRLRRIFATLVRPVNTMIYRSAYSRTFSSMSGTSRSILIRAWAGVK